MTVNLKNRTTGGFVWSAIERFSVQFMQFIILLIMAKLLTPQEYGLIGMLTVFIALSQSLVDSGFSQALIRKRNRSEVDNSTVFYFNIVVALLLYIICYCIAPLVADFYEIDELCTVMRVICLSIVINSFVVVQRALLTGTLDFKTQAKASLIAVVVSGFVGISMAYYGLGVWALVCQQLINLGINVSLLWFFSSWRPIRAYSWQSFRELFSFGSKLMISGLIDSIYTNIYQIVIGKLFSANDLGHYSRAHQFGALPSTNITQILQRVSYPVLCEVQNEKSKLESTYRRLIKIAAFAVFPIMMILSGLSESIVLVTIGDKWLFCAELLQILCFSMMLFPIHSLNLNLLQVQGRSDIFLKLEILKKAIGTLVLCCCVPFGVKAMCYGSICSGILSLIINTHYTGRLLNLGFIKQMTDILPFLILSFAIFALLKVISAVITNSWVLIVIGSITSVGIYAGICKLLKFAELTESIHIFKRVFNISK